MIRRRDNQRRGAAAVEFAFVLPLLFTLMLGTWEAGRVIQTQQVMVNAVREGARLAAQGQIINFSGSYMQILVDSGSPNVKQTVLDCLKGGGISNISGATVSFQFMDGNTSSTEPWQGTKNQRFRITLTIPYANVRITNLNLMNYETLTTHVDWVSMADDPFTINTQIPTWNPSTN